MRLTDFSIYPTTQSLIQSFTHFLIYSQNYMISSSSLHLHSIILTSLQGTTRIFSSIWKTILKRRWSSSSSISSSLYDISDKLLSCFLTFITQINSFRASSHSSLSILSLTIIIPSLTYLLTNLRTSYPSHIYFCTTRWTCTTHPIP